MIIKRLLLLGTLLIAGQFNTALAATSTYYFNGVCDDCNLDDSSGLIGTLVLESYAEGTAIDLSNFVSFTYVGSNLVFPYVVTQASGIGDLGGVIGPAFDAPHNFFVDWEDGLRFETFDTGEWYTCANGVRYYSGTCDFILNQDLGAGDWSQTPAVVPIPAAAWLFGSAMIGLIDLARPKA